MSHSIKSEDIESQSPFEFADGFYQYAGRLWQTIVYFMALAVFLVLFVIWAFVDFSFFPGFMIIFFIFYGMILAGFFPIALWYSLRLIGPLKRWIKEYSRFAYTVKFELFPAIGATPNERMLNKLAEIYPEIRKLTVNKPSAVMTNECLSWRCKIQWDLIVDLNPPMRFSNIWIHRHFGVPKYLLMKYLRGPQKVGLDELKDILKKLRSDLKGFNPDIVTIFIVSPVGFEDQALEAVRESSIKELKGYKGYDVELVLERENGYDLAIKD